MRHSPEALLAFAEAATLGSFSAAARKLGKRQSTISEAIANLEIDLGLTLFDRSTRQPTLTEAELRSAAKYYSISFPQDYRTFLKRVGNGSAGPGMGLEPLLPRKGKGPKSPSKPFPLQRPHQRNSEMWNLDEGDWSDETKQYAKKHEETNATLDCQAGTFELVNYGCGISAKLVLNGRFRGQVWVLDPNNGEYVPFGEFANLHYPDQQLKKKDQQKPFTFTEWYEHWLNHTLSFVKRGASGAK